MKVHENQKFILFSQVPETKFSRQSSSKSGMNYYQLYVESYHSLHNATYFCRFHSAIEEFFTEF